jgi:cyclopropane fatty-acyl-phospholipid synthase-like methyltransferase
VDPKQIVAAGYDAIAETYRDWAEADSWPRLEWLALLEAELADGAAVLELGCGAGLPVTRALAERHRVTGIDISARQIELARENVPGATFLQADALAVELPRFDAVVSLYMSGHVPRDEQPELLRRIAGWLGAGGLLLMTLTRRGSDGVVEDDWLGAPMFFAGDDAETNLTRVRETGFEVLRAEVVPQEEFGREIAFLWVLARRTGS